MLKRCPDQLSCSAPVSAPPFCAPGSWKMSGIGVINARSILDEFVQRRENLSINLDGSFQGVNSIFYH